MTTHKFNPWLHVITLLEEVGSLLRPKKLNHIFHLLQRATDLCLPQKETLTLASMLTFLVSGESIQLLRSILMILKMLWRGYWVRMNCKKYCYSKGRSPLTTKIQAELLPKGFKLPPLDSYNGSGNLDDHLNHFQSVMMLCEFSHAIYSITFLTMLRS